MKRQVWMAVIMIAIIVTLSPVYGDVVVATGQVGQVSDTNDQVGSIGGIEVPAEQTPQPEVPKASVSPQGQTGERGAQGAQGSRGQRGPQGLRGQQGPAGRPGSDHRHSKSSYAVAKDMNPASVSHVNSVKQYVDRRDNSTLGKAKAYTDGALKGVAAQKGATTEKDRDGGAIFPWWLLPLLGWLLFAAIIIALLWALWSGLRGLWIQFIDWILCHRCPPTIEEEPEAKPEPAKSPDIVNTDDGDYYGYDSAPARVNCFFDGTTVIKKWKGVWNRSKGCSWKWAAADKEVEVNFGVGDKMTFGLSRENTGNVPVSTEGVVIRDDFNARTFGKFVPGSGKLIVSSKVVRDLDDALIERVMSGYAIKLSDLIDILPAKSSATIVYSVSCVPGGSTTGPAGGVPDEHDAPSQPLVRLADLEAKWATEAAAKKAEEDAKAKAEADAKAKIEAEAKAKAEAEVKAKAKTEKNADKDKTESAKNEKAKDKPKKEPVKVEDNKPKPEPEPTKKTEDVDIAKLIDSEFEEEN